MDYTTKISVLKRAIHKFTAKISAGMTRPFQKFTADMCYGAMAARSCVLSEIAQSLQEDTKKINTVERLARHLNAEIPETVHSNYTNITSGGEFAYTQKAVQSCVDRFGHATFVMDRGYYSADNINALYKEHLKFLCGTSTAVSFAKAFIREIGAQKDHYEYYNSDLELYIFSRTIAWDYEQERPYIGDTVHEERRMYLHLYFNPDKLSDDGKIFNKKLDRLKEELLSGKRVPEHEKDYRKYFVIRETPKRGITLSYKQAAIDAARERYGFFVLISNEVKDPVTALSLYRMRDIVEKAFWNIKERLNLRRTLTSSESALEGKLFVEFVALIYLSYIKKKMEDAGLFSKYTMHELLDELDVIECFTEPGKAPVQGEVLKKQEQIYRDLDVTPLLATPEAGK